MKTVLALLLLFTASTAPGHEVRPAYLDLHEVRDGEFRVLWKTPLRGDRRLSLWPVFSGKTEALTGIATRLTDDAAVQSWRLKAVEPLRGQSVRISGLEGTMTDALVRVDFADGAAWTLRVTPGQPEIVIPARESGFAVAGLYLKLGIEHILLGFDHLLFVLALLIITPGTWPLAKTITAFTLAHSITLATATLGFVQIPAAPVEAVIALSIVFVASEIVHAGRGRVHLTARAPWIVAFVFGLLHGFGFAGALREVGLPPGQIPEALLFFNLGVEAGQLIFVAAVLTVSAAGRKRRVPLPSWIKLAPPYAIGSVAMFWVIQRVAAF
jgi:hydrogenase/urease accessory protein HupE